MLGRYDYKVEPNDITLEQNITTKLISSSIEFTANEIKKLREAINLLKQTAENQKDLFSEELRHCNEEIRFLKRKFEERNKIRSRKSRQEQQLDTRNGEPHVCINFVLVFTYHKLFIFNFYFFSLFSCKIEVESLQY